MSTAAAISTLFRRRFALTAHTPRQIVVPLLTPILFALVIAPACRQRSAASGPTSTTRPSSPSAPSACWCR
jgi:hypothetical protein